MWWVIADWLSQIENMLASHIHIDKLITDFVTKNVSFHYQWIRILSTWADMGDCYIS